MRFGRKRFYRVVAILFIYLLLNLYLIHDCKYTMYGIFVKPSTIFVRDIMILHTVVGGGHKYSLCLSAVKYFEILITFLNYPGILPNLIESLFMIRRWYPEYFLFVFYLYGLRYIHSVVKVKFLKFQKLSKTEACLWSKASI